MSDLPAACLQCGTPCGPADACVGHQGDGDTGDAWWSDGIGMENGGNPPAKSPHSTPPCRLCIHCLAARVRALTFGGPLEDAAARSRAAARFDFAALLRREGHVTVPFNADNDGNGGDDGKAGGSGVVVFEDHDVMRLLAGRDDEAATRFFANTLFAAERAQQAANLELRILDILRQGSAAGVQDADTGRIIAPAARESRRAALIAALPGSQMCTRCGFGPVLPPSAAQGASADTSCVRCCGVGQRPWDGRLPHETDACDIASADAGNDAGGKMLSEWSLAKNQSALARENLPAGTVVVCPNPAANPRRANGTDTAFASCAMWSGFRRGNDPHDLATGRIGGNPNTNAVRRGNDSSSASVCLLGVVVGPDDTDDRVKFQGRVKVRTENGFLLLLDPQTLMPVHAGAGLRVWVRMKVAPEERGDAAGGGGDDEAALAGGWVLAGNALAPPTNGSLRGGVRGFWSIGGCCPSMSNLVSAGRGPQDARWVVTQPDSVVLRQRPSLDSPAQSPTPLDTGVMLLQDCSASPAIVVHDGIGADSNDSNNGSNSNASINPIIAAVLGHSGQWRSAPGQPAHGPVIRGAHWSCCGATSHAAHCTDGPVSVGTRVLVCRECTKPIFKMDGRNIEERYNHYAPFLGLPEQRTDVGVVTGAADAAGFYRVRIPRRSGENGNDDDGGGGSALDEAVSRKAMLPLRLNDADREVLLAAARGASVSRSMSAQLQQIQGLYPDREKGLVYAVPSKHEERNEPEILCYFAKARILQREDGSCHRVQQKLVQVEILSAHQDCHTAPTQTMHLPDTWKAFARGAKQLLLAAARRERHEKVQSNPDVPYPLETALQRAERAFSSTEKELRSKVTAINKTAQDIHQAVNEAAKSVQLAQKGKEEQRANLKKNPLYERFVDAYERASSTVPGTDGAGDANEVSDAVSSALLSELQDKRNRLSIDSAHARSVLRGLAYVSAIWSTDAQSETRSYQVEKELSIESCVSGPAFGEALFGTARYPPRDAATAFVASLAKLHAWLLLADDCMDTQRARWAFGMLDHLLQSLPDPEEAAKRGKAIYGTLWQFLEDLLVMRKALYGNGPRALLPKEEISPAEACTLVLTLSQMAQTSANVIKRKDLTEVRCFAHPPPHMIECVAGLFMLLTGPIAKASGGNYAKLHDIVKNASDWRFVKKHLVGNDRNFVQQLHELIQQTTAAPLAESGPLPEHWAALEKHIERCPAAFDVYNMRRISVLTWRICEIIQNLRHVRRLRRELSSVPAAELERAARNTSGESKQAPSLAELDADTMAFRRAGGALADSVRRVKTETQRLVKTQSRMQGVQEELDKVRAVCDQMRADIEVILKRGVTREQDQVRCVIIMRRTSGPPRPRRNDDTSDEEGQAGWNGSAGGGRFSHNGWSRVGTVYNQATYMAAFRAGMLANDGRTLLVCAPYQQGMFGARGRPGPAVPGAVTKDRLRNRPMCEGDSQFPGLLLGERVEVKVKSRRRRRFRPGQGDCGRIAAITRTDEADSDEAGFDGDAKAAPASSYRYSVRLDKDAFGAVLVENVDAKNIYWLPWVGDGCHDPYIENLTSSEEE